MFVPASGESESSAFKDNGYWPCVIMAKRERISETKLQVTVQWLSAHGLILRRLLRGFNNGDVDVAITYSGVLNE